MAYGATGTTKIAAMALALTGAGRARHSPCWGSRCWRWGSRSRSPPRRSTCGRRTCTRSTDTDRRIHVGRDEGRRVRGIDPRAGRRVQALAWDWAPVVWGLAAASVVIGSILAIAQTNVKRMLAYSSIAHAGFILTGLTASGSAGIRAAMFYLVAYAAMTVGAFGAVMVVSGRGGGPGSATTRPRPHEPGRGGSDDPLPAVARRYPPPRGSSPR